MKLLNRIASVIAAGVCLALALSGVASAHGTSIQYNNSYAWVTSGHHAIGVADRDGNNRELWVEYNVRDSANRVTFGGIVKDPDGALPGHRGYRVLPKSFGRYRHQIHSYRICEANRPPRARDLGKHCTDFRGT